MGLKTRTKGSVTEGTATLIPGMFGTRQAHQTDLKQALAIGLDEAFTALDEAMVGLTDAEFWAFPLEHRHNVVTLIEHSLQVLDEYGCEVQGYPLTFDPDSRFDAIRFSADELRPKLTGLPTVGQVRGRVLAVRQAVMGVLRDVSSADLSQADPSSWWFTQNPGKVRADAFMRATGHTLGHVRQVWFLRGLMAVTDDRGWPKQFWA